MANCQRVGKLAVAGAGPEPPFRNVPMYVLVLMAPADTLRIASMATYYFSSIDVIFALRGRCATEVVVDLRMAIHILFGAGQRMSIEGHALVMPMPATGSI